MASTNDAGAEPVRWTCGVGRRPSTPQQAHVMLFVLSAEALRARLHPGAVAVPVTCGRSRLDDDALTHTNRTLELHARRADKRVTSCKFPNRARHAWSVVPGFGLAALEIPT